jgi:hypothetical protein
MKLTKYAPWIAFALALIGAGVAALPQGKVRGFDVSAFGQLPVLEGGRVKPLDTTARNSLLMIRGQQSFLDVLFRPDVADAQPVFVINDPEVLGLMGLQQTQNRYYPFTTLAPHLDELQRQAQAAQAIDTKQRDRVQNAFVNLFERVYLYYKLKSTVQLPGSPLVAEIAYAKNENAGQRHAALAELAEFRPIAPAAGTTGDGGWRSVGEALRGVARGEVVPALVPWARLGVAYAAQDAATFNRLVGEVAALDAGVRQEAVVQGGHEVVFNRAQPFYTGMAIYVLALLVVFVSWLRWGELLRRIAFGLLVAGAVVHTAGLASRVILQGRPPVTNLYSSAGAS